MKQKALTQGNVTTRINMTYNGANQMISMSSPRNKIQYNYDKNGNMTSKAMGRLQDTYAYDALDRLVSYAGYDGFEQVYTYDAHNLRATMAQKGDPHRLTLEEMLQGKRLEERAAAVPDVDEWVKTSYIYDITLPYGQLLTETTHGVTTAYTYGLERIAALNGTLKTQYRYGHETGRFTSPEGTPFENRSLPPGSENRPFHTYEVLKPFDVLEGDVAPWFDQPGGGIQYMLPDSIENLINDGYLRRVE